MIAIEEAIHRLASTDPVLQSRLGVGGNGLLARYTPARLPETPVYPAVTYDLIDTQHTQSHSGLSGLGITRLQLSVWGKKYADAQIVELALRSVLAGGKRTVIDCRVDGVMIEPTRGDFEPDTQVFRRMFDIIAVHAEDAP